MDLSIISKAGVAIKAIEDKASNSALDLITGPLTLVQTGMRIARLEELWLEPLRMKLRWKMINDYRWNRIGPSASTIKYKFSYATSITLLVPISSILSAGSCH